jgi:polyphosphate kinase
MFPVKDPACRRAVESILSLQLADNVKSWRLESDGSYVRRSAAANRINAQEMLLANVGAVLVGHWQGGSAAAGFGTPNDGKAEDE